MGIFRRKSEQRTIPSFPALPASADSWWWYHPEQDLTNQPQNALGNPDVFAATRVLCDAASSCPLVVYRRQADGERRRAQGRTTDLLNAPSEGTTQAGFVATAMSHLLLHGNFFCGKYRGETGVSSSCWLIRPTWCRSSVAPAGSCSRSRDERGRESEHGLDDIVHVKALSTDGLRGLSPIRQMRLAIEGNDAVRQASTALFRNNARPSGILKLASTSDSNTLERLKDTWENRHTGDRQGGIAVLAGDAEFTAIGMPADDAEFVAARKLSAVEVARCFRIPPWMIGAEQESMTYSNVESQQISFAVHSLNPWLTTIEQALSADKDLFSQNLFCEFLVDGLLRADSATRAAVYEKALNPATGWLHRDEVRRLENLPPETPNQLANLLADATTNGAVVA